MSSDTTRIATTLSMLSVLVFALTRPCVSIHIWLTTFLPSPRPCSPLASRAPRSQVRRTSAVFKYEVPIKTANPPPLEPQPSSHTQPSALRLPNDPSPAMRLSNDRNRRRSSIIGKLAPLGSSPPKGSSHVENDASAAQDSKPKTQTVNLVFTNQRERRSSCSLAEPMDMYTHPLVKQQQLQLAVNLKMAQEAQVRYIGRRMSFHAVHAQ